MNKPVIGFLAAGPFVDAALDSGSEQMGGVSGLHGQQHVVKYGTISNVPTACLYPFGYAGDNYNGEPPRSMPRFLSTPSHHTDFTSQVAAFWRLGVQVVLSFNGWGSLHGEERPQGAIGVPSDVLDHSNISPPSIFPADFGWSRAEMGRPVGGPFCSYYRDVLVAVVRELYQGKVGGRAFFTQARLVTVNGPRNETEAEIEHYRSSADIIGTNMVKVFYFREIGIPYVSLCYVSDVPGVHSTGQWASIPPTEVAEVVRLFAQRLPASTVCDCKREFKARLKGLRGFWPDFILANRDLILAEK